MLIPLIIVVVIMVALVLGNCPPVALTDMVPFIKPCHSFNNLPAANKINYSDPGSWFFHQGKNVQETELKADVFFVHRTTFLKRSAWNAAINNKVLNAVTYFFAVKVPCQGFAHTARVFAPKYRQATLYSFYDSGCNGASALELAYNDVKEAFLHYLQNHNQGRPVILAGHSQGTYHLERLMHEFFDNNEKLRQRLVCAYLLAMPVQRNSFKNIRPATSPDGIGCFVSWSTFGINAYPLYFKGQYDEALCTNPLNWVNDSKVIAGKSLHKGSVTYYLNRKESQKVTAYSDKGVLHINDPGLGYFRLRKKDYVTMDYHIFFQNIRENVQDRIENYYKQQS